MTLEDRIKTHNQRVDDAETRKIKELEERISELQPKVTEILRYANLCVDNNISLPYKFKTDKADYADQYESGMHLLREDSTKYFNWVGYVDSIYNCWVNSAGEIYSKHSANNKSGYITGMTNYVENLRAFYNKFIDYIEKL